jgi:hypothetical protein
VNEPELIRPARLAESLNDREAALARQVEEQVKRAEKVEHDFNLYRSQRNPWRPGRVFGVAIMISWNDLGSAIQQLDWIAELGGFGAFGAVISVPHDLPKDLGQAIQARAPSAELVCRPFRLSAEAWPVGPNWSFACVSQWCHDRQWDFLLLEPDAVPLKRGWLEAIEREYRGCGRAFMGYHEPPGVDHQMHLAGVAVYHWEAYQRLHWHEFHRAWDVTLGPTLVAEAHQARTIQQVWGTPGAPPTFPLASDVERIIRPEAALFHRNKDGTLIQRLREALT